MRILLIDGRRRSRLESGYGRIAAALADGLPGLGHEIAFDLGERFDLSLYTSPPFSMRKVHLPGAPRVGFTMHESETLDEAKRDWPDILNALDLIFTPTAWNRDVWQRLGVRTPIEVVPVGINPDVYYPGTGHRCVFLAVHEALGESHPHTREDWAETLSAYYAAFTAADRVSCESRRGTGFPTSSRTRGAPQRPSIRTLRGIPPWRSWTRHSRTRR